MATSAPAAPTAAPAPIPSSILAALAAHAQHRPDQPCLRVEGRTYSYGALWQETLRWAGALRAWGLRGGGARTPGDRVALLLENSDTFIIAYLGVQLAGGIVVLVNTQYRQVELGHILADSGARLCITSHSGLAELNRVAADLPTLECAIVVDGTGVSPDSTLRGLPASRLLDGESNLDTSAAPALPDPGAVALIAYTSGTTGRSKGAMLTHGSLAANSWAVTQAWRWTAGDRLLLTLPLFHVHGLCVGVHGTLLTGASVDLRRKFDAREVYDALLAGAATMFFGVPTMYTRLIAEVRQRTERPKPLRLYVSGSAPLAPQTFAEFEALFGQRILERYGMSETIMNLTNPYDGERRPGTVGQPFPGQEARIVDVRTRAPIEDERPGEIQVRGPHLFKGYWQRPDATAEAFDAEGWFNTGDLGWRSADGYFTISGRAWELIITGGYNVYPREVEEVLEMHPAVAEAAVLGLPDPEFGEQIAAAIVVVPGASPPSPDDLAGHCRERLASYKKPRQVFVVDALPRNALGKIQKHVLKEHLTAR